MCSTSLEFDDEGKARKAFLQAEERIEAEGMGHAIRGDWFALSDPNGNIKQERPAKSKKNPETDDDNEWRAERAMQAGMAFGCDGYNDVMGY